MRAARHWKLARAIASAASLLFLAAGTVAAQLPAASDSARAREITGVVVDASTRAPLPGVLLSLQPSGRKAITDSLGRFVLRVRGGEGPIAAEQLGYATALVALPAPGTRLFTIDLEPDPVLLRGIRVLAERLRFPEMAQGSRRTFGPRDLAGAPVAWSIRDFLAAHGGYAEVPCGFELLRPRPFALGERPDFASIVGWDAQPCALVYGHPVAPTVVVDGQTLYGGLTQLGSVAAYDVHSAAVYNRGAVILVYRKSWLGGQARQLPSLDTLAR